MNVNENQIEQARFGEDVLHLNITKDALVTLSSYSTINYLSIHRLTLADCNLIKSVMEKRIGEMEKEERERQAATA